MGEDLESRIRDTELATIEIRGKVDRLSEDVKGYRTYLDSIIKMQVDISSIEKTIHNISIDFENKIKAANMVGYTILSLLVGVLVKMIFFGDMK